MFHFNSKILLGFVLVNLCFPCLADIIPTSNNSLFYYKLGGGQDIPLPAYYDTAYIPLDVDGSAGLGFNCGAFNPLVSLTNSLNNIKNSFQAVSRQVVDSAKAAITEFPLYELSRADPSLYNILTNGIAEARDDIAVSTKSCQVMQSQIASGQDPYAHWASISVGNKWKEEIGTAELSGKGDINQAKHQADSDAGKSGVPWVNPNTAPTQTQTAGGEGQPPIHVIHDTSMAGYKEILRDQSSDLSANSQGSLVSMWPTPALAAKWIGQVLGEQTITTYNQGKKQSTPGVGLYPDIESQAKQVGTQLADLVDGHLAATIQNLQNASPPGVAISAPMIQAIRQQPKVMQAITINMLSQNIAALRVIEKARLASRILQAGSRVPVIYSNKAAQTNLHQALSTLQQDVSNMLFYVNAKKTLASNMMGTIMQQHAAQTAEQTNVSTTLPNQAVIEAGAVKQTENR